MAKEQSKQIVRPEPSRSGALIEPTGRWFEEMERWFEEDFRRPFSLMRPFLAPRLRTAGFTEIVPSVDIFAEGEDIVVKAELPGMKKEDIEVSMSDNTMTISGEKKQEEKVEKKNYHRVERSYGSFTRSFRLPAEVQMDRAKASYKEGVLEIRVPKSEEAKAKEKKIPVG
jgi:HSP20 family protein